MININKKKLKILILIPARLESVRLNKKPLRLINGIPMIIRVANRAKLLKLGKVIVATDNRDICSLLKKASINFYLTTEKHNSGTDRIYEVYKNLPMKKVDVILNLQGDLPYFSANIITSIIDLMYDKMTDIGTAVCDLQKEEISDLNIVKARVNLEKNETGFAKDFKREIKNLRNYYHHIGIYAYRPEILEKFVSLEQTKSEKDRKLEQLRALNNKMKIKIVKVNEIPPSIDTPEDLKKIRLFFRENNV